MTTLHDVLAAIAQVKAAGRAPRQREEYTLQESLVAQFQWLLPPDAIVTSIDHARPASVATRKLMKKRGIEPGIPDIWILWRPDLAKRLLVICTLETKRQKGGKLTTEQEAWRDALLAIGAYWGAPRTPEEAFAVIHEAGIPLRGRFT